ncbi:condensin complex subunit 3 isoform X1 [Hyla sarda]|uniref:condensin complex subunit 3 isoform X1 n=1 Tax=Hyla sarda TaxID=327740 RepID=UPI0024C4095F|nr:condensin complex subunit 3 isoform X1 [Hyla sarda]
MTGEKKGLQIKEAFDLAQKPHQNLAKLVSALRVTYDKIEDKSIFLEEFTHYLKYPLIVYRREPAVERVMDFVAKFVTSFHNSDSEEEDEMDEENSPVNYLFTFLLQSHVANSNAVRFRVCQLIYKLLVNLPENALIDDDLFDKIHDAMLIRVTDRVPNVRIQAVLALARLQDPSDVNCPVTNAYMHLLENDLNAEVRRAVLSCIAPSARTLPKIVGRTMDVKELVRKLAYQVLAEKVHIRALTIAQRVNLLQLGLNDRSEAVKEVMQKKLLQAWLKYTEGNVLELLHRLDVENSPEVAVSALNAMFALSSVGELVEKCKNVDERKLIPLESLSPENVLYWKALCEYLKTKDEEGEAALEQILPEPAVYVEYLLSYLRTLPVLTEEEKADMTKIEDLMTKAFIGQQLIHIIGCLDTSEEGGRKRLLAVLQEILIMPNVPTSFISSLVEILLNILKDDDRRIITVAEIISELREPIVTVDNPPDVAESRKLQVKIADVKVQLIETKQALEDSINSQDFSRASELKEKVADLEKLKAQLIKEAEEPELKEVRVEKNDPETLLKCLIMCNELLKHISLSKGLGGTLNEIIQSLILPGITNVHPSVRNMAVLCIGCCALQNKDFAKQHLTLLLQISQLDDVKVRTSALNSVIDLLLLFGLEIFSKSKLDGAENPQNNPEELNESSETEELDSNNPEKINEPSEPEKSDSIKTQEEDVEKASTVNAILTLFAEFLDSEIPEIRTETAEGLAKLMFSGRLISSKLLSRLILLWYNPVTDEDTKLRHCLGVFFPIFAYSSRTNQECFAEAFLPTLETLFNAPASSPLADVDVSNVAELLVDLTRPSGLKQQTKASQDYQISTVHDNLALKMCNEIMKDLTSPDVRIYAKALCSLELSKELGKELLPILDSALEDIMDKVCLRALEKVKIQLSDNKIPKESKEVVLVSQEASATNEPESREANQNDENDDVFEVQKTVRGKATRGRKKAASASTRKKSSRSVDPVTEGEAKEAEPVPVATRPSRRAKSIAMEKTKMNLSKLINEEAS